MKLLVLCDSPTLETGFARVARNLLSRWHKASIFEDIWVWGIGYGGFPHSIDFLQNRICPASTFANQEWYHVSNLERFLHLLERDEGVGDTAGGFTHLWMMQDTFLLHPLAQVIKKICESRGIMSVLYFPVDAPLDPIWADIVEAVDRPVAYCEYGRGEAIKALRVPTDDRSRNKSRARAAERIRVIPHGVDTTLYRPAPSPEKALKNRKTMFDGRVATTDFVMVNVNAHQKRKGLAQSLQILKVMKAMYPEISPKLYMHMPAKNEMEQTDLRKVATQMGLEGGVDIFYGDSSFQRGNPLVPEGDLAAIYTACDLLLTTSYGEGWGMPITEAMACGVPVAGPAHTSIAEILADGRGILFRTLGQDVIAFDNSRLRPRSDVDEAAIHIAQAWQAQQSEKNGFPEDRSLKSYAARAYEWARGSFLDWDRIAGDWIKIFKGGVL